MDVTFEPFGRVVVDYELHYDDYEPVYRDIVCCSACRSLIPDDDQLAHRAWHETLRTIHS